MDTVELSLKWLLGVAVVLPLLSFFLILAFGPKMGKGGKFAAYLATLAIGSAGVLSFIALFVFWLPKHHPPPVHHGAHHGAAVEDSDHAASLDHDQHDVASHSSQGGDSAGDDSDEAHPHDEEHAATPYYAGDYYLLGQFGDLRITIGYYIDALTLCMFCMVTLIATCIHFYSWGYMHEELHDVTDHEVHLSDGSHLHRPGRYSRFFQYMSLFCFSMLGLVLSGNIAMVFVFWELVGICSYFLIGFYIERKSASNAANKAFIVNRIGDFGMIIGLMVLWSALGTFAFGEYEYADAEGNTRVQPGIFDLVRTSEENQRFGVATPAGMVRLAASDQVAAAVHKFGPGVSTEQIDAEIADAQREDSTRRYGYWLMILAGIGIFCGCVGKSAQFPLHVWLPDAMEGPTPVSALVHSATMVAAGVYLVGRFYPVFTPEVLLIIAIIGGITLFIAATIAITATDIKRVLAYSTVSQLGYMMLALGVGGWLAGMMHLITHAFFKSLLFLGSGSVIHAVHTNEMTEMGGLRKKMPVTAYTMLIGCLAIAGAGLPFVIGFSGYYSKDRILEQAFSFMNVNTSAWGGLFFLVAAGGAAITSFYMFRLWFMTFAGSPRDQHRYDHAHESPKVMYLPLIVLAVFAIAVAWEPAEAILAAVIGLAVTMFLLLRHWFVGISHSAGERAHGASPTVLYGSLIAAFVALLLIAAVWTNVGVVLVNLLEQARPARTALFETDGAYIHTQATFMETLWPNEFAGHEDKIRLPVTLLAFGTALGGFALAALMYGVGYLSPADARRQFEPIYRFLRNKWWFDELYDWLFVRPLFVISRIVAAIDRRFIDGLIDGTARFTRWFAATFELAADQTIVDGFVNLFASWTYGIGLSLRGLQTGKIRQYVLFIVVGAIAIFILISFFWSPSVAG